MAHLLLRGRPLLATSQPADIKAVLFDKDGTISKSESNLLDLATSRIQHCLRLADSLHQSTLRDLLQKAYGIHPISNPDRPSLDPAGITAVAARDHNLIGTAVVLSLVGYAWPEALAMAQDSFRLADLDHPPGSNCSPMTEGLQEFLAALSDASVHCAVISNDERFGIERFLEHHRLHQQIATVWSADHSPRKPDPQAIHHLCDAMGVAPQNCALIGDANSDLHMARSAGVSVVVGYRGGWQRQVRLAEGYPFIDHWCELSVEEPPDPAVCVSTAT